MRYAFRGSALLLLCSVTSASPQSRAALVASLDSIASAAIKDGRAAGISVGVVKGRDTLLLKGYGYADLEFDVPTPDRAIYEIGSVTKQFTAAAILLLQERGKLSLDDAITKFLPDYPLQGHTLTIRRLMDHTSGIKGYTEMPMFGAFMVQKWPRDSLVARFSKEPFEFAPGDALVYNNSAYFLLGLIIEKASGQSYADFVKQNLFDKAGMPDSRYCSVTEVVKRRAHGYDFGPNGLTLTGYLDHTWPYAAGSLCSTTGDLIAWTRALHGGRVLSQDSYRELITPGKLNDGFQLRYAKGLAITPVAGHRSIHHSGGINGFLSDLAYFPDDDAIVVALVNTGGPVNPGAVVTALAERLLGKVTSADVMKPDNAAEYTGTWKGVGRGGPTNLTIAEENGVLTARLGAQRGALRYLGQDTFETGNNRLVFLREHGKPARLRFDAVSVVSLLQRDR